MSNDTPAPTPHKRRPRYSGKNPRRFEDKYKEHNPERYAETVAKVIASGKTPAGMHVPIMLHEIIEVLALQPGERVVDCTLGYGGHAKALLQAVQPGGILLGLDQDPQEIVKTETRLRSLGFPEESVVVRRMNFAGILRALTEVGWAEGADAVLADLGVSSMQIDNPSRGFSFKHDGPLDMRMNPQRGLPASEVLARVSAEKLQAMLMENADETRAVVLGAALAGRKIERTRELAAMVRSALPRGMAEDDVDATVRRVFQALRIEVNDEFGVLDTWLRALPSSLKPGGRVAVLTFHSGEDRRVKKAFKAGLLDGTYSRIADEVVRAGPEELRLNPRASSAKLRWAVRS
ncbi:MAG: 16S rRNA (cytosine(1402)-N(4))-methyltransferase RsmH [Verrucomicrobiaceae bacterium]|nr:16S rRNA (cytosine(1402)-N(4))-methyltransferase RsmH [Verrucomicrobiaceae bacterium]